MVPMCLDTSAKRSVPLAKVPNYNRKLAVDGIDGFLGTENGIGPILDSHVRICNLFPCHVFLVKRGGIVYHVLNRGVGRMTLFDKPGDYDAFE